MQIIEASDYGVRSAELRLRRRGSSLQFLLYPMLHVGAPEYYQEVTRRLHLVDVIVAEGIGGTDEPDAEPSRTVSWLTSSYRTMAEDEDTGLVVQDIDYEAIGVPVIRPDFTSRQFEERWRTIPLWQRGAALAAFGSLTAAQKLLGSKWLLQFQLEHSGMDDLPSLEELLAPDAVENIERVILGERDQPLLKALIKLHEQRQDEAITVAVVYGAGHVRAVLKGLRPLGYRVVSGEWITVKTA